MELKFNSQVCTDINQSKKLLELGLKPETADCMYFAMSKSYHGTDIPTRDRRYNLVLFFQDEIPIMNHEEYEYIPAWSLHRLFEIYNTSDDCYVVFIDEAFDDLIDNIEWRINKGYLNKEYLKQCQTKGNTESI